MSVPSSKTSFGTPPTSSNTLNSPSHSGLHGNEITAVQALENEHHIHIFGEIPSGSCNDSNTTFVLTYTPRSVTQVGVYLNGMRLVKDTDYTILVKTITTLFIPATGDVIICDYIYFPLYS